MKKYPNRAIFWKLEGVLANVGICEYGEFLIFGDPTTSKMYVPYDEMLDSVEKHLMEIGNKAKHQNT